MKLPPKVIFPDNHKNLLKQPKGLVIRKEYPFAFLIRSNLDNQQDLCPTTFCKCFTNAGVDEVNQQSRSFCFWVRHLDCSANLRHSKRLTKSEFRLCRFEKMPVYSVELKSHLCSASVYAASLFRLFRTCSDFLFSCCTEIPCVFCRFLCSCRTFIVPAVWSIRHSIFFTAQKPQKVNLTKLLASEVMHSFLGLQTCRGILSQGNQRSFRLCVK